MKSAAPKKCANCRQRAVDRDTLDFADQLVHDGRAYPVAVPGLDVFRCRNCAAVILDDAANKKISDALRYAAGLLTPAQIRRKREELRLTQRQLAEHLQIAEATLSRWENGVQIQQRVMDRFLRTFFDVPDAREYLGFAAGASAVEAPEVTSAEAGEATPRHVYIICSEAGGEERSSSLLGFADASSALPSQRIVAGGAWRPLFSGVLPVWMSTGGETFQARTAWPAFDDEEGADGEE